MSRQRLWSSSCRRLWLAGKQSFREPYNPDCGAERVEKNRASTYQRTKNIHMYIVKRNPNNPIIAPEGGSVRETRGTFNGCPVKRGEDTYLLYRTLGNPDPLSAPSGLPLANIAVRDSGADFKKLGQCIVPDQPSDKTRLQNP